MISKTNGLWSKPNTRCVNHASLKSVMTIQSANACQPSSILSKIWMIFLSFYKSKSSSTTKKKIKVAKIQSQKMDASHVRNLCSRVRISIRFICVRRRLDSMKIALLIKFSTVWSWCINPWKLYAKSVTPFLQEMILVSTSANEF